MLRVRQEEEVEEMEEDDTHLCIKCNTEIIGLGNYIEHRKSFCSTTKLIRTRTTVDQEETETGGGERTTKLGEEENVAHKQPEKSKPSGGHSHPEKSPGGDGQSSFGMKLMESSFEGPEEEVNFHFVPGASSPSKSKDPFHLDYDLIEGQKRSMSGGFREDSEKKGPPVQLMYSGEYDDADLFFSSLQLQSSSKKQVNSSTGTPGPGLGKTSSSSVGRGLGKNINIMSKPHQLYYSEEDSEDEDLEDDDDEEDSEELLDSDEEEDEFLFSDEERNYGVPPRTHTGGKWKPEHRPNQNKFSPGHSSSWPSSFKDDVVPGGHSPPPNYTRGKWVPGKEPTLSSSISGFTQLTAKSAIKTAATPHHQQQQQNPNQQPSDDTSRWCSVCNRKLASQKIYEKHLQSNLHKKQEAMEIELGEPRRITNPGMRMSPSPTAARQRTRSSVGSDTASGRGGEDAPFSFSPRTRTTPSSATASGNYSIKQSRLSGDPLMEDAPDPEGDFQAGKSESQLKDSKGRKPRRKIFMVCPVCRTKVRITMFGRHLLSHRHLQRMDREGPRKFLADKTVLENFEQVVPLLPFQCQICRFFATSHEMFMKHWRDPSHALQVKSQKVEKMWCSSCDRFRGSPQEMEKHLESHEHQGVVQAFNKTVPVVIRSWSSLACEKCGKEFQFNFSLRRHSCAGEEEVEGSSKTATDHYQSIIDCLECGDQFRTVRQLKSHSERFHNQRTYRCHPCDLKFNCAEEAAKHRQTLEHRVTAKKEKSGPRVETCRHCSREFEDLIQLKRHIKEKHPEELFSCLMCGQQFAFPQDLSRHVRDKKCSQEVSHEDQTRNSSVGSFSCKSCSFSSSSEAELLFHETLSHQGLNLSKKPKIPCPLCSKTFTKSSLLPHLRRHKGERIFQCPKCHKSYPRKQNVVTHMKTCLGREAEEESLLKPMVLPVEQILEQQRDKEGPSEPVVLNCTFDGCEYSTTSKRNLKKHYEIHLERNFKCQICDYKTKTERYLRKHMAIHEKKAEAPSQCPLCKKIFKNAMNLRTHILTTSSHKGMYLYNCPTCSFKSNFLGQLKEHRNNCGKGS